MHPEFSRTDHRPWPLPQRPWTWRQSWKDLLFAHWPVPVEVLEPLVPQELSVQQFNGTSWVGIVPFQMTGVMRRPFPDLPWVSAFPELNVRLYVECDGKPGVWFLSLDASNPLAVWAARRWFHLPYHTADMRIVHEVNRYRFTSVRRGTDGSVLFRGEYGPTSEVFEAQTGTLEHFLTERYCLYCSAPDGNLYRGEVHHRPWPLQLAHAELQAQSLVEHYKIAIREEPHLLFSQGVDVVVWSLEQLTDF